jgi:hypothetical protein
LALLLGVLVGFPLLPVAADEPPAADEPALGRLSSPEAAHMVVRRESCRCTALESGAADVVLLTVGSESQRDGEEEFQPLATFAFDRSLGHDEPGQWIGMWVFGTSGPGWWRSFRATLPFPSGTPSTSEKTLEQLDARLEEIRTDPEDAALLVPDPVVDLHNLGRYPHSQTLWMGLRRGLSWANVFNPAQFVYRAYLMRRQDRNDRRFQRAYLALQWLLDLEYTGDQTLPWLHTASDIRFHLLRNRSFFGRWLEHADAVEMVYNYDSDIRSNLGKGSSWLQSAANEHLLGYEPIYRYARNGAPSPVAGVLYYDPRLKAQPDPGWWSVANPFDLPYNPHTNPEVQRLAREHPDEPIPLAIYTFETNLGLRPIIAVDFFSHGNPKRRERNQQLMVLAKQWLSLTTGPLDLTRIPYRVTAWAANKKGFTYLVDKSSRRGIEELRLALQENLYFDPTLIPALEKRADQRVLNPLVRPSSVEERVAHIQYESLRAQDDKALCERIRKVREEMRHQLHVPGGLSPEEERAEMSRRLEAWQQEERLEDFVSQPLEDFGSLGSLSDPLRYFLESDPVDAERFEELLAKLYGKLYRQQLRLPADRPVPELNETQELTQQVWKRTLADEEEYEQHRSKVERKAQEKYNKELARQRRAQQERFADFIQESRKEIERAQKAGCNTDKAFPSELEAHLSVLKEVLSTASTEDNLRAELARRGPRLQRELAKLDTTLSGCPAQEEEVWAAQSRDASLELVRHLVQTLSGETAVVAAKGE